VHLMMYLQTLKQQMGSDWNAGANMLAAITIVSLNLTETGPFIAYLGILIGTF
jgi:hypothetical protein